METEGRIYLQNTYGTSGITASFLHVAPEGYSEDQRGAWTSWPVQALDFSVGKGERAAGAGVLLFSEITRPNWEML